MNDRLAGKAYIGRSDVLRPRSASTVGA